MLRSDASYPYPVIRTTAGDFGKTVFKDDIKVEAGIDGYKLTTNFSVNNPAIQNMLNKGLLKYAVSITCKSTLLREMYYVDVVPSEIMIDAGNVHYQVNYIAYIIANEEISHYTNEDFSEDYKGIEFRLKRGDIVGIGTPRLFKALYERDQINDVSSIITVSGSDTQNYMTVDLDNPQIKVILPKEQLSLYKTCGNRKDKYSLLHSVVVIPALMEAIYVAQTAEDGSEEAQRPWCITLQQQIKQLSSMLHESEEFLYEHPLRTAQIIMNNNSKSALNSIEEIP